MFEDDYVFNEQGNFVRIDKNNNPDQIVVENSKTGARNNYLFADPVEDPKAIANGTINKVVFVSFSTQIPNVNSKSIIMNKYIFVAMAVVIFCIGCKDTTKYNIFYPKRLCSGNGIKELKTKLSGFDNPDNPYQNGNKFYVFRDTIRSFKMSARLLFTYRNGNMKAVSYDFYGDTIPKELIFFYDSCYHKKSDSMGQEFYYGRSNAEMSDTVILKVDKSKHTVGYYFFKSKITYALEVGWYFSLYCW